MTAPASRLNPQQAAATPLARIECRSGHGEVTASVAFPVGSPTSLLADDAALRIDDPARAVGLCKAIVHDTTGSPIESIAISGGRRLKASLLLTLQHAPARSGATPPVSGATPASLDGKAVHMATLMPAGPGRFIKVRSGGHAYAVREGHDARRDAPGQVLMATDYDSVSAARGSPVFNEAGRIIGVHRGAYCPAGDMFDKNDCFNTFGLLDLK